MEYNNICNRLQEVDVILKSKRKQVIMETLKRDQMVTLETLMRLIDTSESTIRRDLDELEVENKLRRVHGGAELRQGLQDELTNQQKSIKNSHEKARIAEVASQMIDQRDVIFIDAGTTTAFLIEKLHSLEVTVVTNSIHHATALVDKGIKTIIIGGTVKLSTDASVGHMAIEQVNRLNLDKAFIGMNGIDSEFLTTPDFDEATIKRAVIANSQQTFVLADASKIGQKAFVKVDTIDKVVIITDKCTTAVVQELQKKTRVIEV
ncbi:DeoR/GlpR family DNA-binding transcription regulator [Streptococcus sciuri]|uniref:DeoR/GlpR family DNA-binding transcription regulator n=1 Tax=Streptococcus sciuri TaxID=2973939 RepID=A0ABT2F5F4_9STRE|nr:DeoR/GlpR family DNA-binding transcription regulator [Streptococcus sciuri]MCS4487705.1 DeoR/GlpR family DNA-binding transcription regulator [Streptococcus sciuri]